MVMPKPDYKILLVAGIHGDEHEVIDCVARALARYQSQLPGAIFIPQMSPSACAARTRQNGEGVDLNRQFLSNTQSAEARAVVERLAGERFDLCLSFHEDLREDKFYFYDSQDMEGEAKLDKLRQ